MRSILTGVAALLGAAGICSAAEHRPCGDESAGRAALRRPSARPGRATSTSQHVPGYAGRARLGWPDYHPLLAKSWTISETAELYLKLRERRDVLQRQEVTAADVIYSFSG